MTADPAKEVRAGLRVLGTSDLHMHLESHDYCSGRDDPGVGLTRAAQLIRAARNEAEAQGDAVLLFDNGDSLQGTPLGDVAAEDCTLPHPLMACFRALGYDAIGLGNHDFNFGLPVLSRILAQSPCPALCTNLALSNHHAIFQPHLVLNRVIICSDGRPRPVRIGVFSVLPPQTLDWDAHVLNGQARVRDMVDCARATVKELKRDGCDLIVLLAHTGFGEPGHVEGQENALIPLSGIEGIDAVIAGHTHQVFPDPAETERAAGKVNGIPVAMPGYGGSHLAVIDLQLVWHPDTGWQVTDGTCGLHAIARRGGSGQAEPLVEPATDLRDLIAEAHLLTVQKLQASVGETPVPLHSYFTFFAPDRALALVAAAQAAAVRACLDDPDLKALPLISAVAPSKFGGRAGPLSFTDVSPGPVTQRNAADLCVFPNELRAVVLTGDGIRDWLEMAAGQFLQVPPGSCGAPLMDPKVPGHNFDVMHGLTYEIDLGKPARFDSAGRRISDAEGRICNLRLDGAPLTGDRKLIVATNNYRVNGGGNFTALAGARCVDLPPMRIRDVLCAYLAGRLPRDPLADAPPPWRFARMDGTAVTARTGPAARHHMQELQERGITDLGLTPDGFLKLSIPI